MSGTATPQRPKTAEASQHTPIEADTVDRAQEATEMLEPAIPPSVYEVGEPNQDTVRAIMRRLSERDQSKVV